MINAKVDGENFTCLIDSGAEVNLIDNRKCCGKPILDTPPMATKTLDGTVIPISAGYSLSVEVTDAENVAKESSQVLYGANLGRYDLILGYPWLMQNSPRINWRQGKLYWRDWKNEVECVGFEKLQAELQPGEKIFAMYPGQKWKTVAAFEATSVDVIPGCYAAYEDVFSAKLADTLLESSEYDHAIELEGKMPPHLPLYNLSKTELDTLKDYLDSALEKGWIQESSSPAGAPIIFVPKKDGSMRLCVDYRKLNAITVKNRYPLPLVSEMLDRFGKAKIFTKLDVRNAYHRIRIRPGDEWKTAFKTRYGHYEYRVMPFGLANAPATFQNYIHRALGGLLDSICVVYLDDILIYSVDETQHEEHVKRVLERLRNWGLYVKTSKCSFSQKQVEFLGYIVDSTGVHMDPERIKTIVEWPEPGSAREVLIFLGFTNFYRRFVEGYSELTAPLHQLVADVNASRKKWEWAKESIVTWEKLKERFSNAPVLWHFNPELPITVFTDASAFARAAILLQTDESDGAQRHLHPVAYYSKKFSGPAMRYDTHDKELMAIWDAFVHWRHYLAGAKFPIKVLSDHNNLRYFMTTKQLTGRQARWAEYLSGFDFEIEHRAGTRNPADGPSRRPDYQDDKMIQVSNDCMLPTLQRKLRYREHSEARFLDEKQRGADHSPKEDRAEVAHVRSTVSDAIGTQQAKETQMSHHISRVAVIAVASAESAFADDVHKDLASFIVNVQRADVFVQNKQYLSRQVPTLSEKSTALESDLLAEIPQGQGVPIEKFGLRSDSTFEKNVPREKHGIPMKPGWEFDTRGILRYRSKVWIPKCEALKSELMERNHDGQAAGHFGHAKTLSLLRRKYFWTNMSSEVKLYIKSCVICQRCKSRRHMPYGELQPLPIPSSPWRDYSMDFIVGLPPCKSEAANTCDACLVIVDRFSKLVKYISTTTSVDSPMLVELIMNNIVLNHGVPDSIVSDRGTVFTSEYWSSIMYLLKVKKRLSTAFHPQSDGQTE